MSLKSLWKPLLDQIHSLHKVAIPLKRMVSDVVYMVYAQLSNTNIFGIATLTLVKAITDSRLKANLLQTARMCKIYALCLLRSFSQLLIVAPTHASLNCPQHSSKQPGNRSKSASHEWLLWSDVYIDNGRQTQL